MPVLGCSEKGPYTDIPVPALSPARWPPHPRSRPPLRRLPAFGISLLPSGSRHRGWTRRCPPRSWARAPRSHQVTMAATCGSRRKEPSAGASWRANWRRSGIKPLPRASRGGWGSGTLQQHQRLRRAAPAHSRGRLRGVSQRVRTKDPEVPPSLRALPDACFALVPPRSPIAPGAPRDGELRLPPPAPHEPHATPYKNRARFIERCSGLSSPFAAGLALPAMGGLGSAHPLASSWCRA